MMPLRTAGSLSIVALIAISAARAGSECNSVNCTDLFFLGNETVHLPDEFHCYGPAQEGVAFCPQTGHFVTSLGTCEFDGQIVKQMRLSRYLRDTGGAWVLERSAQPSYPGIADLCHIGDIDCIGEHVFAPLSQYGSLPSGYSVHIARFDLGDLAYSTHWDVTFPAGEFDASSDLAGIGIAVPHLYAVQYQECGPMDAAIHRWTLDGVDLVESSRQRFPIATRYANGIAIKGIYAYVSRGAVVDEEAPWGYIDIYDLATLSTTDINVPVACHRFNVGFHRCVKANSHAQGLTFEDDNLWVCAVAGTEVRKLEPPLLPPSAVTIGLQISPPAVPIDGASFATLTATVRNTQGAPVQGAFVTFQQLGHESGGFVNCSSGAFAPQPNNGLTDAAGRRTTCYRPTAAGEYLFSAAIAGESDTASFHGSPPSDIDLTVSGHQASACLYDIDVAATHQTSGMGVSFGKVYLSTNCGQFVDGEGAPGSAVCVELNGAGLGDALLQSTDTCDATITACFVGEKDQACQPSSICESFLIGLNCGVPPTVEAHFKLHGTANGVLGYVAAGEGNQRVAAIEHERGVIVWNMHDWSIARVFDGLAQEWAHADPGVNPAIAYADAADRILVTNDDAIAVFDVSSGTMTVRDVGTSCVPPTRPTRDSDWSPTASTALVLSRCRSGPCGCQEERVELYDGSGQYLSVVEALPDGESRIVGCDYSPDGTRLAYSYREFLPNDPDRTLLVIREASGGLIGKFQIQTGDLPGGVAWSPDSQTVAVFDGDGATHLYTRDGGFIRQIPAPPSQLKAGSVSFSPNGQYLAVHFQQSFASIYDVAAGLEVARLVGVSGLSFDDTDTLAWRSDSQVICATNRSAREICVFAPFDITDPILSVTSPSSGAAVSSPMVIISGVLTDNVGVPPNALSVSFDGMPLPNELLSSDGSFMFDLALAPGNHSVILRGADLAGNTSNEVTLEIRRLAPAQLVLSVNGVAIPDGGVVDLGVLHRGTGSLCQSIAFQNAGDLDLSVSCSALITPFELGPCPESSIPGGAQRLIPLCITGSACGSFAALVHVTTDDPEAPFSFEVRGTVTVPGDVNADQVVNSLDLTMLLGCFNMPPQEHCANLDINGDGFVNSLDLTILLGDFGFTCLQALPRGGALNSARELLGADGPRDP